MENRTMPLNQMQPFIEAAFLLDTDLLNYYDKGEKVTTTQDCCDNILLKIANNYPEASCMGVYEDGAPIGYFVYLPGLLISFGLNKKYRNSIYLKEFWETIKESLGNEFDCLLYSYNTRAINWLKKCGMEITLENVTALTTKS